MAPLRVGAAGRDSLKRVRDEEARLEFAGPDPSPPFEAPLLSTFFGVILLGNRIATGSWTLTDSAAACLLLISFGAIWELLFESWKRRGVLPLI